MPFCRRCLKFFLREEFIDTDLLKTICSVLEEENIAVFIGAYYSFLIEQVKNIRGTNGKGKVVMSYNNTFTTSLRHSLREKWYFGTLFLIDIYNLF